VIPPGALACSGTHPVAFFATDGLQALKVEGGDGGAFSSLDYIQITVLSLIIDILSGRL